MYPRVSRFARAKSGKNAKIGAMRGHYCDKGAAFLSTSSSNSNWIRCDYAGDKLGSHAVIQLSTATRRELDSPLLRDPTLHAYACSWSRESKRFLTLRCKLIVMRNFLLSVCFTFTYFYTKSYSLNYNWIESKKFRSFFFSHFLLFWDAKKLE